MAVNKTWPHVTAHRGDESREHVVLKNRGVRWLLQHGFDANDIEHEYTISSGERSARADIYANCGGSVAILEAQTQFSPTNHGVGNAANVGQKKGWPVYVAAADHLYLLKTETRMATNSWGNDPKPFEKTITVKIDDLPRVDLAEF